MKNEYSIFDIKFSLLPKSHILENINTHLSQNKKIVLFTINPEIILLSLKNKELYNAIINSDYNISDGIGILWASTFLSYKSNKWNIFFQFIFSLFSILIYPKHIKKIIPYRITGSDFCYDLWENFSQKNLSVFLLGGQNNASQKTADILQKKYKNIKIAGFYEGKPFTQDDENIINKINQSQGNTLFVAFGAPKQEIWIQKYKNKLIHTKFFIGVGGTFDFVSGNIRRAPTWMQKLNIEWLYRLLQEPKKRVKRIWNAVIIFPYKIFIYKFNMLK